MVITTQNFKGEAPFSSGLMAESLEQSQRSFISYCGSKVVSVRNDNQTFLSVEKQPKEEGANAKAALEKEKAATKLRLLRKRRGTGSKMTVTKQSTEEKNREESYSNSSFAEAIVEPHQGISYPVCDYGVTSVRLNHKVNYAKADDAPKKKMAAMPKKPAIKSRPATKAKPATKVKLETKAQIAQRKPVESGGGTKANISKAQSNMKSALCSSEFSSVDRNANSSVPDSFCPPEAEHITSNTKTLETKATTNFKKSQPAPLEVNILLVCHRSF
jgi:hypothetical protein